MYFRPLPQSYTTRQCHYFLSKVKRKPLVWSSVVIPAAGIAGLWNWKGADSWDGIPELKEIPFVDREVVIVPDNDIWTQKRIDLQKAVYSLGKYLETCGAKVSVIVLPPSINKIGADDYFAAGHSTDEFDQLRRLRLNDLPLAQHKKWYAEWKELREAQPKSEGKTLPAFMTDTEPVQWPSTPPTYSMQSSN